MIKQLEGVWRGEGMGEYPPKVPPFQYIEELTVNPLSKPNTWEIRSSTRNKMTSKPMHIETGFVRAHPADDLSGRVEFVISHPFGLSEVSEGNYTNDNIDVYCRNEGLTRTQSATSPFVTEVRRVYELKRSDNGAHFIDFLFEMATTHSPMQSHLVARLYKVV